MKTEGDCPELWKNRKLGESDLLPLYEDELCSQATRTAVKEHFQECEQCRKQAEEMRKLSAYNIEEEIYPESEEAAVVRSFRKIHRRWLQSLLCVFLIIPVLFLIINQWRGEGICFTNPDDIWAVRRFVTVLEKRDFEKAATCMNYEEIYLRWEEREVIIWENRIYNHVSRTMIPEEIYKEAYPQIEQQALAEYHEWKKIFEKFASKTLEEYTENAQKDFVEDCTLYANKGITFENTGYQGSFWTEKYGNETFEERSLEVF